MALAQSILASYVVPCSLSALKSRTKLSQVIIDLDKNKNNNIDFEEFLDMMTARMSDRDAREDINKAFCLFNDDRTGTISIRYLRRITRELGQTITDEELQEILTAPTPTQRRLCSYPWWFVQYRDKEDFRLRSRCRQTQLLASLFLFWPPESLTSQINCHILDYRELSLKYS